MRSCYTASMKRSDMPFEIDFNDTPQELLTQLCRCGHVALSHGRASWSCRATGCRCKEFVASNPGLHIARCRKGHTNINERGECRSCNAAYQAAYRERKKAKQKALEEQPPGTFDWKGERFTEGGLWAKMREHGWIGAPVVRRPTVYCSIHGCEEPSITVPLCASHSISPERADYIGDEE